MPQITAVSVPRDLAGKYSEYKNSAPQIALAPDPVDAMTALHLLSLDLVFSAKLADDDETPLPVLRLLARSADPHIRGRVAGNESIDADIHELLSVDADGFVRSKTIENIRSSPEFLVRFDTDTDLFVVEELCENKYTSAGRLRELYATPGAPRDRLALNIGLPADLIELMSKDEDPAVRENILHNMRTPADLVNGLHADSDAGVRAQVAAHRLVTLDVLRVLQDDEDAAVRYQVARANIDESIAENLSADPSYAVRNVIARLYAQS